MPHLDVLNARLDNINSRLPQLRKLKKISLDIFLNKIGYDLEEISEQHFLDHLSSLIPFEKIDGLYPVFQVNMREMILKLRLTIPMMT